MLEVTSVSPVVTTLDVFTSGSRDHDAYYRAFQARDARFDGRVFAAVRTTGIYCRPICPARTPKPTNIAFYATAAAAQEAGFRPCLRCRPEVAPELAAWNGSSNTVTRALRLIEHNMDEEPDVDALADRLGIGARQLRRLFVKHLGASPSAVLQTRRVHLAKQLIQDTSLPMAEIAYASGFGSIRRFNEAFKDLFGRPPTALRRARKGGAIDDVQRGITLRLAYSPPYAWEQMLESLRAQALPDVEAIVSGEYVRHLSAPDPDGTIAVRPGRPGELLLRVHCARTDALPSVIGGVRRLFDLGADPRIIDTHLASDPLMAPLVARRPGLRVAGSWRDVLEPDAFVSDDEFVCALQTRTGHHLTYAALLARAERWRPWRAYAAAHLRASLRDCPSARHN